ncbi:MAG: biopolymer transporter ExbD [candidate division KSB1 bacterium]|nr:biopolymer transporter ExbD [candidate division KSB1 bacterium]
MNLKQTLNRKLRGHVRDADVNLTAVMNIFLILIPFLLLTATFVRIAVLELSLPNLDRSGEARATSRPAQPAVLNILLIHPDHLQIKSPDLKFDPIPQKNGSYVWSELRMQLDQVKEKYPDIDDFIISPEDNIEYHIIITVMDNCRQAGFPNISISG